MEELLNVKNGVVGACVLLCLNLLARVGEFMWKMREKKESISDASLEKLTLALQENTFALKHLDQRMTSTEKTLGDIPKLQKDIRRFYSAVKALAGDKWPEIRKEIMEDDITL